MRFTSEQLQGLVYKEIPLSGRSELLLCDGNCNKAWGINHRPSVRFSEADYDDYAFLSDSEVGSAPADPGTYEGGHAKPSESMGATRQNKWCFRECERSISLGDTENFRMPPDFSKRVYNMQSRRLIEEAKVAS